jgi:hypothetical protein
MADVSGKFYSATKVRTGVSPSSPGVEVGETLPPVNPPGSDLNSVGLTMPAAFAVANSPLTSNGTIAVTGAGTTDQYIRGDGSLASFPSLTGYVPYTGATADVDLGTHDLTAERGTFTNNGSSDTLTVNHTSGSGYGIKVTKGGNNEALLVTKTSGSGNAMAVVGGRTALVDLSLSSVSNATGNFLTISGGVVHQRTASETRSDVGAQAQLNGTGFVKASGTTITYDNSTYQVTSDKAQPNGYASLDSNGKVPLTQINDALIGNVNYQGLWNASTNTPTLANPPSSGTKGYYYIVSTAGTFSGISFEVGDWIISSGSAWQKIDNTDAVSSVFGRTGNVVAANGDYTTAQVTESGNLYYTDGRARGALSFAAGSGAYNTSTGVITIPTNNNQITNGAGYITSASTITGASGALSSKDNRTISPSEDNAGQLKFGFTSWANNDSSPYADYLHLRSYSDSTGGNDNLVMFLKSGIGMRIYQQSFGSATAYSSFKDIAFTDGTNASGTWGINITGNAGTVTNGVYTSRTITINGTTQDLSADRTFNVGTVTSVTASSPLFSSGGTTPNITIQQASGSQNGFLSSTDWTTFNNKQNALTNPVTGTGTTNYLPKFTGSTTIGNSQIIDNGTTVGIGVTPTTNKLEVGGGITIGTGFTNNTDIRFNNATNGKIQYIFSDALSGDLGLEAGASVGIKFNTNGANTRMAIFSDGNVTIGNSPSNAGFKLDVNGTGRFTNTLTSEITGSQNLILNSSGGGGGYIEFQRSGAINGFIGNAGSVTGTNTDDIALRSQAGLRFSTGGNNLRLTLDSSTGAATFSSSVTATQMAVGNTSFNGVLSVVGNGATNGLTVKSAGNVGTFPFRVTWSNGTDGSFFCVNDNGNVLINTTTDSGFKLDVNGTGRFTNSTSGNAFTIGTTYAGGRNIQIGVSDGSVLPTASAYINDNTGVGVYIGDNSASTKGLYVKYGGNVLIGTTTDFASARLNVNGAGRFVSNSSSRALYLVQNATNAGNIIQFQNSSGTDVWEVVGRNNQFYIYNNAASAISFYITPSTNNVLIGTTTDTGSDRRLQVSGNLFVDDNATTGNGVQLKNADRPLITRGWDAFTSGNKTGVGRWGVYMESAELFLGSPGTDYSGGLVTIGGWLVNGTRQPNLTVNNQTRNVTATGSITATSFFESSDATIKTLVQDDYQAKGIESIVAKLYIKNGKQELGYYAQDLENVLPSAVNKGSDGLLNLSYREVHTAKIAYLEEEIRQIKKRYEIN